MRSTHTIDGHPVAQLGGDIIVFTNGNVTSRAALLSRGTEIVKKPGERDIPITQDVEERAAEIRAALRRLRRLSGN